MISVQNLDVLAKARRRVVASIEALQRGEAEQVKKIAAWRIARHDPQWDKEAMEAEGAQLRQNLDEIKSALAKEYIQLRTVDDRMRAAAEIVHAHNTKPCLVGAVPHSWVVLETFPSGNVRRRRCSVCSTEDRVGR